jgi:hypothetical protein
MRSELARCNLVTAHMHEFLTVERVLDLKRAARPQFCFGEGADQASAIIRNPHPVIGAQCYRP